VVVRVGGKSGAAPGVGMKLTVGCSKGLQHGANQELSSLLPYMTLTVAQHEV
jgi:hypothetical protein